MICLTLPFPDARLNPNKSKGTHWAATSALRKAARTEAHVIARNAIIRNALWRVGGTDDLAVSITFVQPDKRKRDRDNLLAALKPSLDGIADALGVNDSQFEPMTISREYGSKPGSVRLVITERSE